MVKDDDDDYRFEFYQAPKVNGLRNFCSSVLRCPLPLKMPLPFTYGNYRNYVNTPIIIMSLIFIALAGFEGFKIYNDYGRITSLISYQRDHKNLE